MWGGCWCGPCSGGLALQEAPSNVLLCLAGWRCWLLPVGLVLEKATVPPLYPLTGWLAGTENAPTNVPTAAAAGGRLKNSTIKNPKSAKKQNVLTDLLAVWLHAAGTRTSTGFRSPLATSPPSQKQTPRLLEARTARPLNRLLPRSPSVPMPRWVGPLGTACPLCAALGSSSLRFIAPSSPIALLQTFPFDLEALARVGGDGWKVMA